MTRRLREKTRLLQEERDRMGMLVLLSAGFLFGQIQHQIQIRAAENFDSMGGWYWTALLPIHLLWVAWILRQFFNRFAVMGMAVFVATHILASFVGGSTGTAINSVYEHWLFQLFVFFCALFHAINPPAGH